MSEIRVKLASELLKNARNLLGGLSQVEMARQLETPLRTYTGWESGEAGVPGVAIIAVNLLIERDRWVMNNVNIGIHQRAIQQHPHGIMSAPIPEDE